MFLNLDTDGLVLIGIGLLLRLVIGRRRFNRKNLAGLQVFPNYIASQVIPILEWIINALGLLSICSGLVMMVV